MQTKTKFSVGICLIFLLGMLQTSYGQQFEIPSWIKNNAKWWSEGQIKDSDFITGIQYLIQNGVMKVPSTSGSTTKSNQIPTWIKNNAGWWANGKITDNDFVSGIQYLIQSGIINVTPVNTQTSTSIDVDLAKCNELKTAAEKRTCQKEIELANKIRNDIAVATKYVIGPATFYYVDNKIEHTSQGGTILTIYFVVENTGSSENIQMSCARQNSCNYVLSDGQKEIQYTTNTLVYGSLTLQPKTPKLLEWTFYEGFDYDPQTDYSFKVKEPWGSGSIPLNLSD